MIIPSARRRLPVALAVAAAIGGTIAAVHYHQLDLTLTHYDARGHLVVARRIVDSITPGWQQIGAIWLPLPHLLNAAPVQIDALYRSGASAIAISIASFAVATGAIAWIVLTLADSIPGALAAAAAFALNPNVVYLQSTPMTEPLLLALITLAVAMLVHLTCHPGRARSATADLELRPVADLKVRTTTAIVFALACLTRYEAWPVTYAALAAAWFVLCRRGHTWRRAWRYVQPIAIYPTVAIVSFAIFSRIVVGAWVASDFFVPENKALGEPVVAAAEIWWGMNQLSGPILLDLAAIGLLLLLITGLTDRRTCDRLVALSLIATAAVPWSAFLDGHPFRIRYMVPLLAIEAIGVGIAVGSVRRVRWIAAALVAIAIAHELRPFDPRAPMVVEAEWDRPNELPRRQVTDCLRARYRGDTIMASMGSLGHYMQDASREGFTIHDFLHEGNGDIWLAALEWPRPFAGWVLIEEKAEGGDLLAKMARERPEFLDGYSRVCEGAGLALYERQNRMLNVTR